MPEIIRFPQNDLSPEAIDVKARDVRRACLLILANNPEPNCRRKILGGELLRFTPSTAAAPPTPPSGPFREPC
jgi:hypothetical protein